jgi:hypothetical protein
MTRGWRFVKSRSGAGAYTTSSAPESHALSCRFAQGIAWLNFDAASNLDPWLESNQPLLYQLTTQLKDVLHDVLVKIQQCGSLKWLLVDHCLNGIDSSLIAAVSAKSLTKRPNTMW